MKTQKQSRDPSAFCDACGCQIRFHDPQVVQVRMVPRPGTGTMPVPRDTPWECYAYVNGGRCGCVAIQPEPVA